MRFGTALRNLAGKARNSTSFSVPLVLILLLALLFPASIEPALANPSTLAWSIVDTPASGGKVIVSPSEIDVIAIGSDDRTFYAVDIPGDLPAGTYPNGKVYKSPNGGITWDLAVTNHLIADGALFPVWNIAMAPNDVRFVVAVTDGDGTGIPPNGGPKRVFVSQDGGASWEDTLIAIVGAEYISCVDVSVDYGGNRDIAIGTRTGVGTGRVLVLERPAFAGWRDQTVAPSTNWTTGDVLALKFSPAYASDTCLMVISANAAGTYLQLGVHDTASNATSWNSEIGYPVLIRDTNYAEPSPTVGQVVTADLEMPYDLSGQTPSSRRYYVSTDVTAAGVQDGVHRIDNNVVYWIRPPVTAPTTGRISSISYYGNYAEGILLAGEVTADPATGMVYVWRTSDFLAITCRWEKSDTYKSPTGGANSGFANAQVVWNPDGTRAYCATSSANPTVGGTGAAPGQWPFAWLTGVAFDESAFSVSPYAEAYERLLTRALKTKDDDIGNIWNQLSLIDTLMGQTGPPFAFFSDVAALEVPEAPGEEAPKDYDILYLASINPNAGGFDSIWRSTSDPLGAVWERILCTATANNDIILRTKQTAYDEGTRSQVIVFTDIGTDKVGYSDNEGQLWHVTQPVTTVTDLTLGANRIMYILNNTVVYRYEWLGGNWLKTHEVDSNLDSGHTIAVPLKNPQRGGEETEDWVIVGETGPPVGMGRVAWVDLTELPLEFKPPVDRRIAVPELGNVHVITDDRFEQNKIIYAASNDIGGASGKIYRWIIDKSIAWDELEPPNSAFYGLAQRNDVLYGAWNFPTAPPPAPNPPGVDRTLYPRVKVPPRPEWDYMVAGLPVPGDINFPVAFTREPSSLKVSSNEYNTLWAIDNNNYSWANKSGCLWEYTDTAAKVGPWTTAPASGDLIPVDPVTGRANQVDFRWKQLSYASLYELQVAKDSEFSIRILSSDNITPVDQTAPECYFPAGGLVPLQASGLARWGNLETNHTYYWRVRARAATTGDVIRSPWSATMYFTVGAGLPVRTKYPTLTLFSPPYGARDVSRTPGFSWSEMPGTTKYEFVLAKDATLSQVIVKTNVPTTAYAYSGQLDWNATYFWQVKAAEPVVSDPSPVGSFTVIAMPEPEMPAPKQPLALPFWVWAVIAIYAALMAAILALVMAKPRYAVRRRAIAEDTTSPALEQPRNPLAKVWNALIMGIRRRRYLSKDKDKDSGHED